MPGVFTPLKADVEPEVLPVEPVPPAEPVDPPLDRPSRQSG
jgi:hypothetical protein